MRTAGSTGATASDETGGTVLTPALEAEAERLLAGRTRDIQFSPEMHRAYREKNWSQRSKIARAWMVWVASISIAFVPVSFLLAPGSLWLVAAISGLLVPALHACAYMVWRKPISAAVEGLTLMLLINSVMIAYGVLAVLAGGSNYERLLTCIMYVNTIAIVVLNVGYGWSLALMVCSTAIFLGFEIFNPAISLEEAIGTSVFYTMGIYASTIARKTQSILAQKAFLMSLRDQYRSARLKDANRRLEILATCDPLTGLANRRSAEDTIAALWSDHRITKTTIAFVMADIDWFKLLNDTAGHAAGDECIKSIARTIETAVRSGDDTVCRYGGEEFLIVLGNTTPELAWTIAERIRAAVEALGIVNPGIQRANGSSAVMTISLGIAFAQDGASAQLVTKWADDALYDAKHSGRNTVFMATDKSKGDAPSAMSAGTSQRELDEAPIKVAYVADFRTR